VLSAVVAGAGVGVRGVWWMTDTWRPGRGIGITLERECWGGKRMFGGIYYGGEKERMDEMK